uniref:Centrosomal protein kizuna n=1 Tax=Oreochromis aureus TaxID=47969 RepID=A0A668TAC9_OREAU
MLAGFISLMVWQFSPGNHGGAGAVCVGNTFSVLSVCREKRRLELERELFAYSRSDKRALQIKCSKLRSYLKEICDREARAKMRNLELLRDVECIEISMKEYSPDHAPLQQQKPRFFWFNRDAVGTNIYIPSPISMYTYLDFIVIVFLVFVLYVKKHIF